MEGWKVKESKEKKDLNACLFVYLGKASSLVQLCMYQSWDRWTVRTMACCSVPRMQFCFQRNMIVQHRVSHPLSPRNGSLFGKGSFFLTSSLSHTHGKFPGRKKNPVLLYMKIRRRICIRKEGEEEQVGILKGNGTLLNSAFFSPNSFVRERKGRSSQCCCCVHFSPLCDVFVLCQSGVIPAVIIFQRWKKNHKNQGQNKSIPSLFPLLS